MSSKRWTVTKKDHNSIVEQLKRCQENYRTEVTTYDEDTGELRNEVIKLEKEKAELHQKFTEVTKVYKLELYKLREDVLKLVRIMPGSLPL